MAMYPFEPSSVDVRTTVIPSNLWRDELLGYDEWLRSAGLPDSTIKLRDYHLRRMAVTTGREPYEVDLDLLVNYLSRPGWGPYTRRAVRSSIRTFYKWATISGRIGSNPAEHLPSVTAPLGKPRPASEDAIAAALGVPGRVRLMVRLGANAGLRCCEIAQVSTEHLEATAHGWTLRVVGKGSKVRSVPLSDDLAEEILAEGPGYIFPGQIDGHLSAGYVSKLVSRALPAGVTAHRLRHRFASRAFRGQHNLRAVQELLGHASIATTQIYTAVDDMDLRSAALSAA